jgi:hypothetical protein
MGDIDTLAWFLLCTGLTAGGLAGSWLAWRRRGVAAGLRGAAWSLLPLAAFLTGVVVLVGRIGTAVSRFVAGFVFSPAVALGLAVTALSAVLFFVSAALRKREGAARPQAVGETSSRRGRLAADGRAGGDRGADDLGDVEDILRRRGIT